MKSKWTKRKLREHLPETASTKNKKPTSKKRAFITYFYEGEEQISKDTDKPDLASIKAKLLGSVLDFHKKISALGRKSSLNDEKLKLLEKRINLVSTNVIDEIKRSKSLSLSDPLNLAYEQIQCYAKELVSTGEK